MSNPITAERVWTEDFFSLIGMENMTPEEKEEILNKMNDTVQARVYLSIYEQLSDEDKRRLEEISVDEILTFFNERGYDLAALVMEEALRYRLEVAEMFTLASQPLRTAS